MNIFGSQQAIRYMNSKPPDPPSQQHYVLQNYDVLDLCVTKDLMMWPYTTPPNDRAY